MPGVKGIDRRGLRKKYAINAATSSKGIAAHQNPNTRGIIARMIGTTTNGIPSRIIATRVSLSGFAA